MPASAEGGRDEADVGGAGSLRADCRRLCDAAEPVIDVGDPADYTADLDPADFEEKSYVAGIGVIKEEKVQGGDEVVELIEYVPAG